VGSSGFDRKNRHCWYGYADRSRQVALDQTKSRQIKLPRLPSPAATVSRSGRPLRVAVSRGYSAPGKLAIRAFPDLSAPKKIREKSLSLGFQHGH